jgi:hypothetical protein
MRPFGSGNKDQQPRRCGKTLRLSIQQRMQKNMSRTNSQQKNFKANMIKEQAKATEELIAALTEKHTQQMETLIKSTTEAMKQMLTLINNETKEPGKKPDEEKKKNVRNTERNTMKHMSARTVARNTLPKQKMNVGNLKRTTTPPLPTGNQPKAHEGARGP